MNYYPFHIGDYVSATRHLSWEEDAAYRRLLDTYYVQEKPLPADLRAVCRLVLATTDSQREAVRVVLDEFFELTEDGWINSRADAEIHAMREKQQKQRDKANKRWHKQGSEPGNATAMPQHQTNDAAALKTDADAMPPTPTPTPIPKEKDKPPLPPKGGEGREDFDEFWQAYPKKVGKDAAWRAWKKLREPKNVLEAIKSSLDWQRDSEQWTKDGGQYIPNPTTYLNQGRWQDEKPEPVAVRMPARKQDAQADDYESPWDRASRLRMAALAPGAARKPPGYYRNQDNIIDEVPNVPAIESR